MPKQGILNDYDLQANCESSAKNQTCVVCGANPMSFQWGRCSGEAMCIRCGCAYQLKWGTDEQEKEGKYPYPNIQETWIPILKKYWDETHEFVCYGSMSGDRPGLEKFNKWAEDNYPDMFL